VSSSTPGTTATGSVPLTYSKIKGLYENPDRIQSLGRRAWTQTPCPRVQLPNRPVDQPRAMAATTWWMTVMASKEETSKASPLRRPHQSILQLRIELDLFISRTLLGMSHRAVHNVHYDKYDSGSGPQVSFFPGPCLPLLALQNSRKTRMKSVTWVTEPFEMLKG
jgi:hypothetical protein